MVVRSRILLHPLVATTMPFCAYFKYIFRNLPEPQELMQEKRIIVQILVFPEFSFTLFYLLKSNQ